MKTKKIIFFVIIFVFIVGLGFFLWEAFKQPVDNDFTLWEASRIGGYEIKDNPEGKIITNKEYGLTVQAPKDWTVVDYDKDGVGMFSPEIEFNEYGGFVRSAKEKEGCILGIELKKSIELALESTNNTDYLVYLISLVKKDPPVMQKGDMKYEIVTINGKEGIKTTFLDSKGEENYIMIDIPINDVIYSFSNGTIFSKKCIPEFDKFLETVKISR